MKRLTPFEAMELVILHCEYCNRLQRAVRERGLVDPVGIRKRLDSVNRRMFEAMTGEKATDKDIRRMRFA